MTNLSTTLSSDRMFDESLEILARELELSARWRRPAILMALCESEEVHAKAVLALEQRLVNRKEEVVHLSWNEIPDSRAMSASQFPIMADDCIHFLNGFKYSNGNNNPYNHLVEYLDFVFDKKIRTVLWMDANRASDLAHQAPDVWTSCQRVVEFELSSQPAQFHPSSIQEPLQNPRNKINAYPEDETYLLKSELGCPPPIQCGSRNLDSANLLLKLGLLYWRKSNFLEACNVLESALQTATQLQDKHFQAECYNAIALVKSSMGRYEEAIEAYRQVIRLTPEQAAPWNQIGNLCLKVRRNDEAIVAFQKTLEHTPEDPIALIGLGKVYSQIGFMDDAIRVYQKAIEIVPSYAQPWAELGSVYASLGRVDDAIQVYQKSVQIDRLNSRSHMELARLFKKQERYQDAIRSYQNALNLTPENGSLWDELGQVYLALDDLQNAAFYFAKAFKLNPALGRPYSNMALVYASVGKYHEAVAYHNRSIELASSPEERAEFWNRLADTYRQLGEYENAIAAYRSADELTQKSHTGDSRSITTNTPIHPNGDPPHTEPLDLPDDNQAAFKIPDSDFSVELEDTEADRGEISMQFTLPWLEKYASEKDGQNQTSRPEKAQQTHFRFDSMNVDEWNEKGNRHLRTGEYESAIIAFKKVNALDPSNGKAYNNLGFAYLMLGKQEEALSCFKKGIELMDSDQDKALGWNGIGFIYRCRKDYHNAMAAYQKADELDPQNATHRENMEYLHTEPNAQNIQLWMALGELLFNAGNYREAANAYYQAAMLSPTSGACFSRLASSLMFLKKYNEAAYYYQKSIPLLQNKKDKADAWNRLGDAYRKLNKHDNAISAYQTALKLTDEPASLLTRARFSLLSNSRAAV